jgi:CRP/FNR family cyclic AMP-dependent transcriptional regulator
MTQVRSYLQTLMAVDDRPRQLQKGETLFEQGTPGKEMYIVRSGTLVLRAGGRTLEEVGPGGVIGEMALIDASPRSASAVAAEDCSVTMVNEYTLLELVKKVPGLSLEIMRIMAGRLRRANAVAHESAKPRPKPRARKAPASRARSRKPARKKK